MLSDPVAEAFGLIHRHPSGENFCSESMHTNESKSVDLLADTFVFAWSFNRFSIKRNIFFYYNNTSEDAYAKNTQV